MRFYDGLIQEAFRIGIVSSSNRLVLLVPILSSHAIYFPSYA
jgi:hypothetical protein